MERRLSRKKRPHRKYYESSAWRCRGGKPRDDPVPEIGSIPVPLGSRFQFYLGPPASLAPLVPPRSSSKRNFIRPVVAILQRGSYKQECGSICTKRERERERERERDSLAGSARDGLQQVVKYERRIVRFKRHLCLSIKFTRLSFQHCAACHFASPPPSLLVILAPESHASTLWPRVLVVHVVGLPRRPRLASSRPSRSLPCGRATCFVRCISWNARISLAIAKRAVPAIMNYRL